MMDSPVEFVDDPPGGDPPGGGATPDRREETRQRQLARTVRVLLGRGRLEIAALTGWAAAAVLCLIASFQTVFTYRFDGVAIHTRGGFVASGRSLDPLLSDEHGPRFAIMFVVCAVWFVVLVAVLAQDGLGHPASSVARHAAAIGLAGTFLLVGLLSGLVLWLEATYSSYNSLAGALSQNGDIGVRLHIGPSLWLGLAALACAVAALVLTVLRGREPVAVPAAQLQAADAVSTADRHEGPGADPSSEPDVDGPGEGDEPTEELLPSPRRAAVRRVHPDGDQTG
jgi:hypothetical protein